MHKEFECEECDKVFKYETTIEKHIEAVHEDIKLFCAYFNNNKDGCIYLH